MKKSIALLVCTGCIFFTSLTTNAQQVQDKLKPVTDRGNSEIPKKPADKNRISEDKNTKPIVPGGEAKPVNNNIPAPPANNVDPGDNKIKPVVVPEKKSNMIGSASTVAGEIPNTVLPKPVMTNMSPTVTTTAPVKKRSTAVIAEQQKQN